MAHRRSVQRSGVAGGIGRALLVCAAAAFAPGARADDIPLGAHRLHIECSGSGAPAVVFDAGLGGSALEWHSVVERLRPLTRVCTYDRAGYGASDSGPLPRTSSQIANELYLLLTGAGEDGPFVLVGHSFGGYNMQVFARRYPYLVTGLVLVDASHPDQVERFLAPPLRMLTAPSSRHGIVEYREPPPPHVALPGPLRREIAARARRWKTRRALGNELLSFRDSARAVREAGPLPPVSLLVVTRGRMDGAATARRTQVETLWLALQGELAAERPDATHVVARHSGHHVHIEQPALLAALVGRLVTRLRGVPAGDGPVLATADIGWLRDGLGLRPPPVVARHCAMMPCTLPVDGAP